MNHRNAARRILAILGVSGTVVLAAGCGPRADDINTVQPGYVKKGIFQTGDEWYMRRTIVKSETTNAIAVEGSGDIFLDRVKFRIDENLLIAYKPYEAVPGSQDGERDGKQNFEGPVLAAWPIVSQFDIVRGYDPATGNKTNMIGENSTDRPWYDRDYMRVNFSENIVEKSMTAGWGAYELVYYPFEDADGTILDHATSSRWTELDSQPTNPFASRFTPDYVEITNSVILGMDVWTCATYTGFSRDAFSHCGYGQAQVRTSFARVTEKSDFIPRDYPDSVVVKDDQGKVTYDPETGEVVREPILDRFGYYRIETPTYDRGYGYTESGRLYRAAQFKIWDRYTDAAGNELPVAQRNPKPIIYYMNAEFPDRWKSVAFEVATEYNKVLKKMVGDLQGKAESAVPDMYEIRVNDCNADHIRQFVSANQNLLFAVSRAVCKQGDSCNATDLANLDKIGIGNLEKVCTSLEAATRDAETGVAAFQWQRIGDARTKMLVWLSNPQDSGWGGYGPFHSDSRTGESVSATAFLRGHYYEMAAATIADYVELMNGTLSVEDLIYGQNIRQQVQKTVEKARNLSVARAGSGLIARLKNRMWALGNNREERLKVMEPNEQINRLKRIEGTKIEERVTTEEELILASRGTWRRGTQVDDELRQLASPVGWATKLDPMSTAREATRKRLTESGFCFLNLDFDQHYAGLAQELQGLPRDQIYERVARRMIKHVMLHELGHNFGLDHNFQGSYDALNYYDEFWKAHYQDDKVASHYDEYRNTTVMEYMSLKGMFSDRLGKYDEAALRFAYANQVQVFNQVDPAVVPGGRKLDAWRLLHDYSSIPNYLCGGNCASPEEAQAKIGDRKWVTFDVQNPPANEVPYEWCSPSYSWRTPFCKVFDYGSNQREIHANFYTMWSAYYYFNNFVRDRLTWDWTSAMTPMQYAMVNANIVNQYLYYLAALDPNFLDTELGQDMAVSVSQALNMAAEIIATPEPVRECPWPGATPATYIPSGYFPSGCDDFAPLDSAYSIAAQQIQVPLGPARPPSLGFTDDFVEYDISFVGSYFDKARTLFYLGLNRPVMFRFDYQIDQRSYQASLYRLFEPEIRSFLDRLVAFDPYLIDPQTAQDLGSYWCRDPDNMDMAFMGHMETRQMIDTNSGTTWPAPSVDCANPALIYPTLLFNMPFDAMLWAHVLYSSDFDSQMDLGKSFRIFVVGADDEPTSWRTLPANQICEIADNLTGLRYRAVHEPVGTPDLGCRMIERAGVAVVDYENDPANDFLKERYRSWFERLEFARDLTRIFNP